MFCYIKYSDKPATVMSSVEDILKTAPKKRDRSVSGSIKSITSMRDSKQSIYSTEQKNNLLMVNPDCYIQLLIDYIYEQIGLDINIKFDLCDENGILLGIDKLKPQESGLKLLNDRQTYVVVIYEKDQNDVIKSIEPLIYKATKQESDFFIKFIKNISMNIRKNSSITKSSLKKGPKSAGSLTSKKSKSSRTSKKKRKSSASAGSRKSVKSK